MIPSTFFLYETEETCNNIEHRVGFNFLLKISLSWEILDKLRTLALYLILLFNKSFLLPVNVCKIVEWVATSVDPDQTPRSAASDLVYNVC